MRKYTEEEEIRIIQASEWIEQGNIEEAEAFYEEAMVLYKKAMVVYTALMYAKGKVEALKRMAKIFCNQGQYQHSLEYLERAQEIAEQNQFYLIKASLYSGMGRTYYRLGDYERALAKHNKA